MTPMQLVFKFIIISVKASHFPLYIFKYNTEWILLFDAKFVFNIFSGM